MATQVHERVRIDANPSAPRNEPDPGESHAAVTVEATMRDYLASRGIIPREAPVEEWYVDNWVRIEMWGRRVPVFPIYGFKKSLILHDINHVLSGYDTDWVGEFEIAAWELSSGGCGHYYLYWVDRFVFVSLGFLFAPRRTWRGFRRGFTHKNVFDRDPMELMTVDLEVLRHETVH